MQLCYSDYMKEGPRLYNRSIERLEYLWTNIPCNGNEDETSKRKCSKCDLLGRFVKKVSPQILDELEAHLKGANRKKRKAKVKEGDTYKEEEEPEEEEREEVDSDADKLEDYRTREGQSSEEL